MSHPLIEKIVEDSKDCIPCVECGKIVSDPHRKEVLGMPIFAPFCSDKCHDSWAQKCCDNLIEDYKRDYPELFKEKRGVA